MRQRERNNTVASLRQSRGPYFRCDKMVSVPIRERGEETLPLIFANDMP